MLKTTAKRRAMPPSEDVSDVIYFTRLEFRVEAGLSWTLTYTLTKARVRFDASMLADWNIHRSSVSALSFLLFLSLPRSPSSFTTHFCALLVSLHLLNSYPKHNYVNMHIRVFDVTNSSDSKEQGNK